MKKTKKQSQNLPIGMQKCLMGDTRTRTAKDGECFIVVTFKERLPDGKIRSIEGYKRYLLKNAEHDKIIKCNYCDNPAVHIDKLRPFHEELTYCKDHKFAWYEKHLVDFFLIEENCRHRIARSCGHYENLNDKEKRLFVIQITSDRKSVRCCMENCPLWKKLRVQSKASKSQDSKPK
ncbi:MAG: hypothetical protein WC375_08060 [Methanomassiliicoccales archaeon]|jgi:hypothetical protein